MKEITEVLKAAYHWGRDNGEGRSDKNFNDFLNTSVVSKLEFLVNQEVEKRIKEIAKDAWFEGMKQGVKFDREDRNIKTIMETEPRVSFDDWLRSRLTPQVTPQVQKEGGNQ